MKLLLHICCAPCSVACISSLRAEGIEPTGYWNNPNIHPVTEYRARLGALTDYAKSINLPLHLDDSYGLRMFCAAIGTDYANRCEKCYRMRLEATAAYAEAHGYDAFSTTLLISPYQRHDLIKAIAEESAQKFNIPFLYRDWRASFRDGQNQARSNGLYMQKYCGCIFSEEDRYLGEQH